MPPGGDPTDETTVAAPALPAVASRMPHRIRALEPRGPDRTETGPTIVLPSSVVAPAVAAAAAVAQQPVGPDGAAALAYADRLRSMGPSDTSAEIARLSDISDARYSPFPTMQLAVALMQTRNTQDSLRAQALLQRILANSGDDARRLHPLARILFSRLSDQRRLEDQIDRQAQQLRDNQRRIDQLNERLEAVRAIERSLTRNGNPLAAPASPAAPGLPAPAAAPRP